MILVDEFYNGLGASGVADGDFVLLDGKTKIQAKTDHIVLIFDESITGTPQELRRLFELARVLGQSIPFTSKKGALGLQIQYNSPEMQTQTALNQVAVAVKHVYTR
jgi:hypothetical protein